jgi:hypothetical protein
MLTCINLIEGDITTQLDPAFVTGEYQSLRDFHATREKQAADIFKTNVETLERLFRLILAARGGGSSP